MAIDLIGNNRFSRCECGSNVGGMTTHGTLARVTLAIERRPPRARLRQSSLVWALTATHFVSRAGGMVRSFLVLYLTQERQLSPTMAGAVVAAVGVGDVGSQLLGGWLGDRIGRRHTMLVGFLGTAVALVALGSAETMPAIWAAAVGVGLMAELFRPAGSAAVADLPPRQRVRAFGLLFWAANLGFSVATVTAGIVAQNGYGLLFWINAAASVLAALIVWRHVPETRPPTPKATRRALLPVLLRDPVMLAMAAIHVVYFATFLQTFSTLPLVMAGDGHGPGTYGAVLALNGIVVVQPIAVRLLEGRDRASVLAVSMLLVGVGGGLGAVVHSGASHAGSILVWTLGEIGIAVMFGATFADLAPADLRGRYMGVASTTWSLGAVLGPLLGTALLDHAGRTTLWAACSATGLALFAAQQAVAPALRRRSSAPAYDLRPPLQGPPDPTSLGRHMWAPNSLPNHRPTRLRPRRERPMNLPKIVSHDEWLVARKRLLAKEKDFTRARDRLNAERRRLPMVRIDKEYVFDGPDGKATLFDLFDGRRQLIVYHFMFDPAWDAGREGCSIVVDNIGHLAHLHARDTSLVLVSRAPLPKLLAYQKRMGWTVPWYSSYGSEFNYDFHVTGDESVAPVEYNYRDQPELLAMGDDVTGEGHGLSAFLRGEADVFHTYSTYARGTDLLNSTFNYLDLTALGRQEPWEEPPGRSWLPASGWWWRRHDEYEQEINDSRSRCPG